MPTDHTLSADTAKLGGTDAVRVTDVPTYLRKHYTWAYLNPIGRDIFDHPTIVSAILWGNYHKLIRSALAEIPSGSKTLQTACVYGAFSVRLAEAIGPHGHLDVLDVASIQVTHTQRKLQPFAHAHVFICDAATPPDETYDNIVCFFLLHEVPDDYKSRIMDAILARVRPGGKAVFVDYHRPKAWHPLKPIMWLVFKTLEPFASALWSRDIHSYAQTPDAFSWHKQEYFGGLYQKVVATRL